MITVTTSLITEEMKYLAISNCIGEITENNLFIEFKMTDKMFKPFWMQAKAVLGYSCINDDNFTFQFHDDQYPLLD